MTLRVEKFGTIASSVTAGSSNECADEKAITSNPGRARRMR